MRVTATGFSDEPAKSEVSSPFLKFFYVGAVPGKVPRKKGMKNSKPAAVPADLEPVFINRAQTAFCIQKGAGLIQINVKPVRSGGNCFSPGRFSKSVMFFKTAKPAPAADTVPIAAHFSPLLVICRGEVTRPLSSAPVIQKDL